MSLIAVAQNSSAAEISICKDGAHGYNDCRNVSAGKLPDMRLEKTHGDPVSAKRMRKLIDDDRTKTDKAKEDAAILAPFEAKVRTAESLVFRRKQEFEADAEIPEMVSGGKRNFARFMTKMHAREDMMNLAAANYRDALQKLNVARTSRGLPSQPAGTTHDPEKFSWAIDYWNAVKAEVEAAKQKEIILRATGVMLD